MMSYLVCIAVYLTAILLVDWRQTLMIVRNPHRWREGNKFLRYFLDKTENKDKVVDVYFSLAILLLWAFIFLFQGYENLVAIVLFVCVSMQTYTIASNFSHGLNPFKRG